MVSLIRYAHRRWLSARQANAAQAVPAVHAAPAQAAAAEEEARLCANAQTNRKSTYHAARQCATAIYCLAAEVVAMALPPTSTADVAQTDTLATDSAGAASTDAACAAATDAFGAAFRRELERTRAAAARAPSDASVLYTRRAALEAAMAALPRLGLAQLSAALLDDELHWALTQIRRAPWHEVLWQHRRWLLCWRAQRRAVTHHKLVSDGTAPCRHSPACGDVDRSCSGRTVGGYGFVNGLIGFVGSALGTSAYLCTRGRLRRRRGAIGAELRLLGSRDECSAAGCDCGAACSGGAVRSAALTVVSAAAQATAGPGI